MTVPYRSFKTIDHATADLTNPNVQNVKSSWSATHISGYYLGSQKHVDGSWLHWWYGIAKPSTSDWSLLSGADEAIDFWWLINFSVVSNTSARAQVASSIKTTDRYLSGDVSNMAVISGQIYDVAKDWTNYPGINVAGQFGDGKFLVFGDMPKDYWLYGCPYRASVGPIDNDNQANYIATGINVRMEQPWGGDIGAGEILKIQGVFQEIRIRVFNAVVNSISKLIVLPGGGETLVLSGLGFDNDDAEITNAGNNTNSSTPVGGWLDDVREISFIGRSGEGTFVLTSAAGDFVIDSNSQITIASLPALPIGTYDIKLKKTGLASRLTSGHMPESYAGDWRVDGSGEMSVGSRIFLTVGSGGGGTTRGRTPLLGADWEFLIDGLIVHKYYSPIDIRAPLKFYDGRILQVSNFTRAISSGIGTYLGCDLDIVLSNADKEFSVLLFDAYVKNQAVALYYIWIGEMESSKTALSAFIVDDYELSGTEFRAKLRDIGSKYFQTTIPAYLCTLDEFPNIYEKAINAPKPEILGKFEFAATDKKGAIVAHYIDTASFTYIAARGSLFAITAVYSAGALVNPANYTVWYDSLGQTFITFSGDQGDAEITFDAEGYEYSPWNSANGYVQNPAYILEFFLAFIVGVPASRLDSVAFDTLAAYFVSVGVDEAGKFAATSEESCEEYFRQLLYTYGTLAAFDVFGRWTVMRKDLASLAVYEMIWAQIDPIDHPIRNFNTKAAFNRMRAKWDYVPAAGLFKGGQVFEYAPSIAILDATIEPSTDPDFKWIDSAAWVAIRADEEFRKYAFGDSKFTLKMPIDWLDKIDLLDNIKLQDLFGVNASGVGDPGRMMYVESLTPDLDAMNIEVICADLSWLLAEAFILADPLMSENWADAGPEERIFGYLCDPSGTFADGTPGKKL